MSKPSPSFLFQFPSFSLVIENNDSHLYPVVAIKSKLSNLSTLLLYITFQAQITSTIDTFTMKPFLTVITFFVSTFLHAQIFASPQRFSEVVYGQPKADSSDYRLPTNVIPLEYAILLQPNFLDDTFSGYINIRVNVVEETSSITFHAAEIQFEETTVLNSQGRNIPIVEETDDEERQFRILQFQDNLPVGTYDLWISYKGVINEERRGVYKSSYTTTENVIK